jgi:hypothetical protein
MISRLGNLMKLLLLVCFLGLLWIPFHNQPCLPCSAFRCFTGTSSCAALRVFIGFFVLVTVMGFMASRWQSGKGEQLDEWGLGGRNFGMWITRFLVSGDFHTVYTVIAVAGRAGPTSRCN